MCALGIALLHGASVRAEGISENPRTAMRAAAQEAADTEPDPAKLTRKLLPRNGKNTGDALNTSIRAAVRDEVNRAAAEGTLAPGRSGNTPAASNSNGNSDGNGERHGPSEMETLHSAASSAEQAKRNANVQTEHGNGVKAHGTAGAPGQNKNDLHIGAAKR